MKVNHYPTCQRAEKPKAKVRESQGNQQIEEYKQEFDEEIIKQFDELVKVLYRGESKVSKKKVINNYMLMFGSRPTKVAFMDTKT